MFTSHFARFTSAAIFCAALAFSPLTAPAQGQTPTTLYSFAGGGPANPQNNAIAQGRDGNFYFTTCIPLSTNSVVFNMTPSGTLDTVYTPSNCSYGLTLGSDGNIYSTTGNNDGAAGLYGSVYKLTPTGTATTLHTFTNGADGSYPYWPPIEAANGVLYGTTQDQIASSTAYSITASGTFTTLHTFTGSDGQSVNGLVQGTDGNFYGSSQSGGANNLGVIFKMTATGAVTVLHSFAGSDGAVGRWNLLQAKDGNFYGVTLNGGANGAGVIYKITSTGTYTVLYSFPNTGNASTGTYPYSSLIQATNGLLYGLTGNVGGPWAFGAIYSFNTTTLAYTTLYNFTGGTDGGQPYGALMQHTDGLLYGTTYVGGNVSGADYCNTVEYDGELVGVGGCGTVFTENIGAKAFIRLQTISGTVGAKIGIFGQGFSSTSVVKFNGVAAVKPVLSGTTYITATVPAGATDGFVTVTTGTSTLTSTQSFTVHNSWSSGTVMPTARFGAFTGAIGNNIYVIGGATNSGYQVTGVNEIYNTVTNKWTTGASDPTARELGASAVVNGILYLIGGSLGGSNPVNLVEAYNPTTNTWTTKSAMPTAMNSMPAVVDKNIIYVIGGYDPNTQVWYNSVESYNPATDTWTAEASLPVGTSWESVGLLGSTIVAADGQTGPSGAPVGTTEGYNPTTNLWSTLPADPTPRLESCFAAINGDLYAAAGASTTTVLSLNESYNATTKKWTTLAPIPTALETAGSATLGGRLFCFGGENPTTSTVYNDVQIYQP